MGSCRLLVACVVERGRLQPLDAIEPHDRTDDHVPDLPLFADAAGRAGRDDQFRLHLLDDLLPHVVIRQRVVPLRQLFHALISDGCAFVPISMERENQPIVVVDESRLDFVFDRVRLIRIKAHVADFDWLALFIFSFIGDLVGLRLPLPDVRSFK